MNWSTNTMTYNGDIVSVPFTTSQGDTVTTAYDPTIVTYNSELWLAFECAGTGSNLSNTFSSSCIAPINASTYAVDTSRLTIAVRGESVTGSSNGHSASVPKIFVSGGTPYVYWTANQFVNGPNGYLLTTTATRGAQLVQETSSLHRLWVSGSIGSAATSTGGLTTEVLGIVSGDTMLNGVADGFDVQIVGSRIVLTAGVGGQGCTTPGSPTFGCYRLKVFSSTTPLGTDVFNGSVVSSPTFPFNPQEYSRIFSDGSGNKVMMGNYFSPSTTGSSVPASTISPNFVYYASDPSTYTWGSSDSPPTPHPSLAAIYLSSTFDVLQNFILSCDATNPIPNDYDGSCVSAVSRFCATQGYASGGLPLEWSGRANNINCLTGTHASRQFVGVSTLTGYNAGCTISHMFKDSCASAIAAYCRAGGYVGGFGPMEFASGNAQVICMDGTIASVFSTSFSNLSAQVPACTSTSWTSSGECLTAVSRYCRSQGYDSGVGITDHYLSSATVNCIKQGVPS